MKKHALALSISLFMMLLAGCVNPLASAPTSTPTPTQPLPTLALAALQTPPLTSEAATSAPTATPSPTSTATPKLAATESTQQGSTPSPTATATFIPEASPQAAETGETPTVAPRSTPYAPCMLDPACVPEPAPPVERLQTTENILFLGTDRREGWDNWRTDTIMLVIIDWEINQVAVVSFPRDLYVYHPFFGKKRINAFDYLGESYGYQGGGFQVMKDIFEYNFGVPIQHVIRAHRGAFVEFVDAIGGIDVTLDCDLWELSPQPDGNGYKVLYLPAGTHHLDGETALAFATYRYRTNDWGRARRQQAVLAALKDQAAQLGLLTKAPQLWDIVSRNVSTDLGFSDMLRYAKFGLDMDMTSIHSHVFSGRELDVAELPSGADVLLPKDDVVIPDVLENIFLYVPISVQGTHPKGCPPPPAWAPDYLASLTPTPPPQ